MTKIPAAIEIFREYVANGHQSKPGKAGDVMNAVLLLADAYLAERDEPPAFTCYHIFRHYGTPLAAMDSGYSSERRETAIRDFVVLRMDDDESFGEAWARLEREGWSCRLCSVKPLAALPPTDAGAK